jgi:hypothetical protein
LLIDALLFGSISETALDNVLSLADFIGTDKRREADDLLGENKDAVLL